MRAIAISILVSGLLFAPAPPAPPSQYEDCGSKVCLYPSNDNREPSFEADKGLSRKQRNRSRKRNRRKKAALVTVELLERRGSAFIDGRYVAGAGQEVKPGRHELELRDGDETIVKGVLRVPRKLDSLAIVVHGDR